MGICVENIVKGLNEVGLKKGDTVLFHSDLRSVGKARELARLPNCGADIVIDAILETVGPEGLAVAPTLSATYADREPCKYAWDPAETPSRVGSITEVFRQRPNTFRSNHPTHSLTAIGARAEEFAYQPEDGSTFDIRGPYRKPYEWDGYILFFGTDNRTNTTIHAVEDWMDLPYMMDAEVLIKGANGTPFKAPVTKAPLGPRDFYRQNSKIEQYLTARNFIKQGKAGNTTVYLMKAKDLVDITTQAIIEDPCILMDTTPNASDWSKEMCEKTIEHVRANFGK